LKKGGSPLFYCCGITDKGNRENNEDAFLINRIVMSSAEMESNASAPMVAAVADGVGGEASGEVASRMALELLSGLKPSAGTDYEKKLRSIHSALQRYGITHNTENMQTTLCALAVSGDGAAVMINVGDSRMYRYRGGKVRQLSRDQSLVQMLYDKGLINDEQKLRHAKKNVIFPVLGSLAEEPKPQIMPVEGGLVHGDVILICTDGLSDHLTNGEIEDILAQPKKLPKRLADMVKRAIDNGSKDNITAVAVTYFN